MDPSTEHLLAEEFGLPVSEKSSVLERLKSFLPVIAADNERIVEEKRRGKEVDIEKLAEGSDEVVEVAFEYGVLEEKPNVVEEDTESPSAG